MTSNEPRATKPIGRQDSQEPIEQLDESGPYVDDDLPYMNFECPDCGFSICEWTDCPECGWYDEGVWEATMEAYQDCRECGQTVLGVLCDTCDTVDVEVDA